MATVEVPSKGKAWNGPWGSLANTGKRAIFRNGANVAVEPGGQNLTMKTTDSEKGLDVIV
jgi:hypothetical protein